MDDLEPDPGGVRNERSYLRLLLRAGEMLDSSLDYRETMLNVCAAAVATVADICALVMPGEHGDLEVIASAARDLARVPDVASAGRFLRSSPGYPPSIVESVVRDGEIIFVPRVTDAFLERHSTSPEHARFIRDMAYESLIVVPVRVIGSGIVGALALVRTSDRAESFDRDVLLFAKDLARRCGDAIARSRTYLEAQEIAANFQRIALPRSLPNVPGLHFDAYYEPAEASSLIGGDWYDAFVLPDGKIGITVGDVTGHGVAAAAFMASLRDALRTALYAGLSLNGVLDVADYLIRQEFPDGEHATANITIVDVKAAVLHVISAGHPGPVMYVPGGHVSDAFTERGLPLGLRDLKTSPQPIQEWSLEPGTMLAYFTDGLTEWDRRPVDGMNQLMEAVARVEVRDAAHPAQALRQAVVRGAHTDDIAILCVRYVGASGGGGGEGPAG